MKFKSIFQKTAAVAAGAFVGAGMYAFGAPYAAIAARSAVHFLGPYIFNQGFWGSMSTVALAEHAGFHAMSNITYYSTGAAAMTTAAVTNLFPAEDQDTEIKSLTI